MVDYAVLAVFAIILATLTIGFLRLIRFVGNACYQMFLPSARQDLHPEKREISRLSRRIESIPVPWGWAGFEFKSPKAPATDAPPSFTATRAPTVTPWGWPSGSRRHVASLWHQREGGYSTGRQALNAASARHALGRRFGDVGKIAGRRILLGEARVPWGW